jgi:hypothetical protein
MYIFSFKQRILIGTCVPIFQCSQLQFKKMKMYIIHVYVFTAKYIKKLKFHVEI